MSGYCHWCDKLSNSIIKKYDKGMLVWVGCISCYDIKTKIEIRPEPARLTDVGKDEDHD